MEVKGFGLIRYTCNTIPNNSDILYIIQMRLNTICTMISNKILSACTDCNEATKKT